jgi:hypothetical protein
MIRLIGRFRNFARTIFLSSHILTHPERPLPDHRFRGRSTTGPTIVTSVALRSNGGINGCFSGFVSETAELKPIWRYPRPPNGLYHLLRNTHQGLKYMEFLEVPLYDDDLGKLVVRLAINLVFLFLIVRVAYHAHQKQMVYVFTFVLMNVMVFFICFTLKKLDLGLGMALGLFAIFAIIRYRTNSINVKEMTYLFIVIGLAVINSLSNKKTSYAELLFVNLIIFTTTMFMEQLFSMRRLRSQTILFDKLDLLKPDQRADLLTNLKDRTGLDVQKVEVKRIDLQKKNAQIVVQYLDPDPASE